MFDPQRTALLWTLPASPQRQHSLHRWSPSSVSKWNSHLRGYHGDYFGDWLLFLRGPLGLSCVMPQGCEGRSLNQKSEFFLTYKSAWRTLSCTVENTPFSSPWYRHPKTQGIHGGEDSFSHTRSTSVLLCPCLPPLNSQQVL